MTFPWFTVGVDVGQRNDWTAIAIIERVHNVPAWSPRDPPQNIGPQSPTAQLHVRALERIPLGTPYPAIVQRVSWLVSQLELAEPQLVVDATGVGRPVVDLFRQGHHKIVGVTITGGDATSNERVRGGEDWRVPKRDLVSALAVLLDAGRLKIANALPHARTLVDELLAFQTRITPSANDTYGARVGAHDDLVLATALACWWADRKRPARCGWFRVELGKI
jgi:hypothetical protein